TSKPKPTPSCGWLFPKPRTMCASTRRPDRRSGQAHSLREEFDPVATGVAAGHLVVGVVLAYVECVRFARSPAQLEAGHQWHEIVAFGQLKQDGPGRDRCHL